MENGYKMHGLHDESSIDGVGGNQQELEVEEEATQGNMDLDGQLMQEQLHSTLVGCISNDFDVNEFKREKEEQEDRINDVVSSDSDDSDDDQGDRDAMPTPVDVMLVPVHAMPLPIPTEVLHAM
jgi:hypothetical protein